jgi:hypothetical protein
MLTGDEMGISGLVQRVANRAAGRLDLARPTNGDAGSSFPTEYW